jgi:cytochrome c5
MSWYRAVSKADDIFWRQFGIILAALVVFGIVVFFIARSIAGDAFLRQTSSPSAVAERIRPAGQVRTGDPGAVVAAAPAPASASPPSKDEGDGETVYNNACAACHATGAAGAPKLTDAAAWAPRLEQGLDALVASVVNGKGAMPPKAGNASLTEDQIRAAVAYMGAQAGGAAPDAAPAAQQAAPAAGGVVEQATAAVKEATATTQAATEAAKEAAATTQAATEATKEAAATTQATAGKPGAEVYNMGCAACHATGAANAPKLTDKAAWEPRAAAGLGALVQTVVTGKGAMPPKGGLMTLTDADIENAVRYMLEQVGIDAGS